MTYEVRHNRLRDARMRDGRRWVKVYRERAWNVALQEARTRSFFGSLMFAVTEYVSMMRG